jgi:hypothetical protein
MRGITSWVLFGAVIATGLGSVGTARAQQAFDLQVALTSTTVTPQTGEVTVSGTATCTSATTGWIYVSVNEPIGITQSVQSSAYQSLRCDPDGEPFRISLYAYEGRFKPGRAVVRVEAGACYQYECDYVTIVDSRMLQP